MSSQPSYLIIGAGVFGVSTAYHLIKRYPEAHIQLIDRTQYPCPLAASWDWNKVIRADYGDIFYMEKALEAIQHWRHDPLFRQFYHQSGLVNIDNTDLGKEILKNYEKLGVKVDAEVVSPERFRAMYGSFYDNTDFSEVGEVFVNRDSGWAEATKALTAYTDAAIEAGVKYTTADIDVLTFGTDGECTGVLTKGGENITADRIILATGAGTAKLIADSAPSRGELQVDGRLVAGAVVTGIVNLDPKKGQQYTEIPVTVHSVLPTRAPLSDQDPYTVKFCRDEAYKNTVKHEASGQEFSSPPNEPGQAQRQPNEALKQRLELVKNGILGEPGKDIKFDKYRVCWDAVTPSQDFIITPHPHSRNLYVATGGSFHGWKFMPTIGRYVVEMLDGTLDPSLAKRWAWDRENKGGAHAHLLPTLELRDL
ncbi:hypothetical protein J4E85_007093 [Alternaria conjuncta]|uniref:uncharacterized protein n=1 Tax=Alternaria conjuncta TaxID=181017 RepID=UPI0022203094|nr:uncharacterized protein J4E85_007093 [Alternaria conjuncta]KAI4925216.1 hypothetical protein J4E85_007093 [Alternaria conjuncta]